KVSMKPCHSLNFIVLLFLVASVSAQEKNVSVSTYFPSSSQILPVQLPLPKYPEDAQKLGFGGTVSVAVTVDETGKVSSVDQVFGPSPFCSSYSHPQLD